MNENYYGGFGIWGIVIVIVVLMLFGGWGNNRNSDYGQHATAASQQEILFGQQFGQLNNRITNLGNGIGNLGYEMQGNIAQLGKDTALGQSGLGQRIDGSKYEITRQMSEGFCGLNANIDAKFAALEKSQLEQRIRQLEESNSRLFIQEQMSGVVRYPTGYTYNAGASPFCGCGVGVGNV